MLDLSKIEAGQLTLSLADYSIKDMVYNVFGTVESLAKNKNLDLKVEMPAQLPAAHGDERRLTQVLLNLVGNALKFTDKGGVTIKASRHLDSFTVSVHRHRPRHRAGRPGQDLRGVPAGRLLDHQAEGRHRPRPRHRQADRRDARRTAVGGIGGGQGRRPSSFTLPVNVERQAQAAQ